MGKVMVRRALTKEATQLSSLFEASHWLAYKDLYPDIYIQSILDQYYTKERIIEEISPLDSSWHGYFIAVQGDSVAGVIGGGMIDSSNGEIYVLYVHPKFMGRGIGGRLLQFYMKYQKYEYGAVSQFVSVTKGNEPAISFYKKHGFQFYRELHAYGSSKKDNDIFWQYNRLIDK